MINYKIKITNINQKKINNKLQHQLKINQKNNSQKTAYTENNQMRSRQPLTINTKINTLNTNEYSQQKQQNNIDKPHVQNKQNKFVRSPTHFLLNNQKEFGERSNFNVTSNVLVKHSDNDYDYHEDEQDEEQNQREYEQITCFSNRNKGNNTYKHNTQNNIIQITKQSQKIKRIKTVQNTNTNCINNTQNNEITTISNNNHALLKPQQQFLHSFYNTSQQFMKNHKPFLQNKRIIFNVKNRNKSNLYHKNINHYFKNSTHTQMYNQKFSNLSRDGGGSGSGGKGLGLAHQLTNIQKLKKQIQQLDKQDFVSYRSKGYTSNDDIKIIENQKINKYNYQNSMIVQWKGKIYQSFNRNLVTRPNSTIGLGMGSKIQGSNTTPTNISGNVTKYCNNHGAFLGSTSHTSMAKKYFSKPKSKSLNKQNSCSYQHTNKPQTYKSTAQLLSENDQNQPNKIIQHSLTTTSILQNINKLNINMNNNNNKMKANTKLNIKLKTQQIAIGLNMFRGRMHRKKVKSSFQIGY